jgi:adenylate cyclase
MKVTFDCAARSCEWFAPDSSLLDVAAASSIPTIAACGGHGICSTCRVEVLEGLEHLAPRSAAEEAQAEKRGWPANVRLACAARVIGSGEVRVRRLITPPSERKRQRRQEKQQGLGQIRSVAVLFADMRDFTPITESCAAFDVIYILNRYFTTLKQAITNQGGQVNLCVGDEISAVFGLEDDPRIACHQAVAAGVDMQQRIATLSRVIEREFGVSLSIGIGIHFGPVIVGRVGPADDLRFGLVGDSVNIASRLEGKTKELGMPILISSAVKAHLGPSGHGDIPGGSTWTVGDARCLQLKGIREPFVLHPVTPWALRPSPDPASGS